MLDWVCWFNYESVHNPVTVLGYFATAKKTDTNIRHTSTVANPKCHVRGVVI